MDRRRKKPMIVIRRYRAGKSGKIMWEFTVYYRDVFTNKTTSRKRRGFMTKIEAEMAAAEFVDFLKIPKFKTRQY